MTHNKIGYVCAVLLLLAAFAMADARFAVTKIPIQSYSLGTASWLAVSSTGKTAVVTTSIAGAASVSFDLTTGKQITQIQVPNPDTENSQGSVLVTDETAYISTSCGVQAFSINTGASLWCNKVTVSGGGPAISAKLDLIFVVSRSGDTLVAVNATSGATAYTVPVTNMAVTQPFVAFGGTILVLPDASGSLSGFEAKSGKKLWMIPGVNAWYHHELQAFSDQFNSNMVVVMGNSGSTVSKIDAKAGKLVWSQKLADPAYASVGVDDVVSVYSSFSYFVYSGSNVAQISQSDGTVKHTASSKASTVNGLLNIQDQWILSLDGTTTVNYYDELDGSYGGSFKLPEAAVVGHGTVSQGKAVVLTESYILQIILA